MRSSGSSATRLRSTRSSTSAWGGFVALSLEDATKAREEVLKICDLEFNLTGDTKATGDIAELLDPGGEFFQARSELRERMLRSIETSPSCKSSRPCAPRTRSARNRSARATRIAHSARCQAHAFGYRRYLIDGQGAELWHDEMMLQLKLSPGDERDMELDALGVGDGSIVSFPDKTISVTRVV